MKSTKSCQETHGLSKRSLEPTPEAAKEYERLESASKLAKENISRLVNLKNTARGKSKETLTQQISRLRSVALIGLRELANVTKTREESLKCSVSVPASSIKEQRPKASQQG